MVPALYTVSSSLFPRPIASVHHLMASVIVGMIFIGYIAYRMENDDFFVGRISKAECECQPAMRR